MTKPKQHLINGDSDFAPIELRTTLVIGRSLIRVVRDGADSLALYSTNTEIAVLDTSSQHLTINRKGNRFSAHKSALDATCYVNGVTFKDHQLIMHDILSFRQQGSPKPLEFQLQYDGHQLVPVRSAEVKASNVCKMYGESTVVQGTNFTIPPGAFVGVFGPSGCGKSTLLKMLAGAIKASDGDITIDEIDVRDNPSDISSLVAMVPQDDVVHGELSVRKALELSAALRLPTHVDNELRCDLTNKILDNLGMVHQKDDLVEKLSGGQRKRVSIGLELLCNTPLLLLDEPFSGLDPANAEDVMLLLTMMSKQGRTIICSTHAVDDTLISQFNHVIIMDRGRILFQGARNDAIKHFHTLDQGVQNISGIYRYLANQAKLNAPALGGGEMRSGPVSAWDVARFLIALALLVLVVWAFSQLLNLQPK